MPNDTDVIPDAKTRHRKLLAAIKESRNRPPRPRQDDLAPPAAALRPDEAQTQRRTARLVAPPIETDGMDNVEAIALDLITASEAIEHALDLDPAVGAWRAAGSPRGGIPRRMRLSGDVEIWEAVPSSTPDDDARAEVLQLEAEKAATDFRASVMGAVRNGKLEVIVWVDGEKRKVSDSAFWHDLPGELGIIAGKVRWQDNKLAGCPLCFDRAAWAAWSGECSGRWPNADAMTNALPAPNDAPRRGNSKAPNKGGRPKTLRFKLQAWMTANPERIGDNIPAMQAAMAPGLRADAKTIRTARKLLLESGSVKTRE